MKASREDTARALRLLAEHRAYEEVRGYDEDGTAAPTQDWRMVTASLIAGCAIVVGLLWLAGMIGAVIDASR